jgi:hypothetical protein
MDRFGADQALPLCHFDRNRIESLLAPAGASTVRA